MIWRISLLVATAVLLEGYFFSAVGGLRGPLIRLTLVVVLYLAALRSTQTALIITMFIGMGLDILYYHSLGWHIIWYCLWFSLLRLGLSRGFLLLSGRWFAALAVALAVIAYHAVFNIIEVWKFGWGIFPKDYWAQISLEIILTSLTVLLFHDLFLLAFNKKELMGGKHS